MAGLRKNNFKGKNIMRFKAPDDLKECGKINSGLIVTLFFISISLSLILHWSNVHAFSPSGCEMDCKKCHSISNPEVKGILQSMKIPQAEIVSIELSPVNGLWEVTVTDKGKKGLFYVDFSKKYILRGPIIEIQSGANKTSERLAKIPESKVDFSRIPLPNALVMGNGKASHKVAVFTDPECPYCGALHQELEKVIQEREDIAFYIILYPLKIHKDAYWKSQSIVCHKSLKMLEDAFLHKPIPKTDCDPREIDANIKLAESLGITGTPAIVLADGRVYSGSIPAKQLIELIQEKQ